MDNSQTFMIKMKPEILQIERFVGDAKTTALFRRNIGVERAKTTALILGACFVVISNHCRIKDSKAQPSLLIPAIATINVSNCYY